MNKSYLYLMTTFMLWGSLYVVSQFVLGKIDCIYCVKLYIFKK